MLLSFQQHYLVNDPLTTPLYVSRIFLLCFSFFVPHWLIDEFNQAILAVRLANLYKVLHNPMALWMDLGREVAVVEIFAWIADSPTSPLHSPSTYKKRVIRSWSRYINIALVLVACINSTLEVADSFRTAKQNLYFSCSCLRSWLATVIRWHKTTGANLVLGRVHKKGRVTARQVATMQGRVARATRATRGTRGIAGVRVQEQQELV